MGTPAVSTLGRLYISLSSNGSYLTAPDESYEFLSETVSAHKTIIDTNGLSGTRSHKKERTRAGNYTVSGGLEFNPTPVDLRKWLPRILGTAESGAGTSGSPYIYAVAETLPYWYYTADRVTKVFHYDGCKVDTATFSASEGELLKLSLGIEGLTEVVAAYTSSGAVSPITSPHALDLTMHPLRFTEGVFTMVGGARPVKSLSLTVNNSLDKGRFNNSITRTALPELDRIVTVQATVPYTYGATTAGNADLYDQTNDGTTATFVFTSTVDTNVVFTLTLATLQVEAESPTMNARGEVMLTLNGTARMSSSTNEIAATLVLS